MSISEAGEQNKRAWEHRAYEFWNRQYGKPEDFAVRLIEKPLDYTISEIINASIAAGFKLQKFEEHRGWNGENIPWEFTIAAVK